MTNTHNIRTATQTTKPTPTGPMPTPIGPYQEVFAEALPQDPRIDYNKVEELVRFMGNGGSGPGPIDHLTKGALVKYAKMAYHEIYA